MRHSFCNAIRCATGLVCLGIGLRIVAQDSPPPQVVEPLDIGFTETTGRELLFLDVEAVTADGRPLPGLTKADFKLKLDMIPRRLYSVDDLCPCSNEPGVPHGAAWNDPERLALVLQSTRPRYVLFFDVSQLRTDGRAQAFAEARRWVREWMQPEDLTQIATQSETFGLKRVTEFTSDRDELLRALDEIETDPEYIDDYPSGLWDRRAQCSTGDVACYYHARKEYFRIRNSFESLLYFVTELDAIPERKVLFLFHQNNAIFPGRLYSASADGLGNVMLDGAPSALVPDVVDLVDRVGGSATTSRTAIYPLVLGSGEVWSVNLGANVADSTGGGYNEDASAAMPLLASAGRGCACIYRLGLRAPDRGSHVYRAKVIADGHELPAKYRLQYLTEDDRWMRRAESALASAGDTTDVALSAAAIVSPGDKDRWDLRVEVAVDIRSLELVPDNTSLQGEWEAGGLLFADDGRKSWEMLDASRVRRRTDTDAPSIVVYERAFDKLPPGEYELRAFAHDRTSDRWGSTRVRLTLPEVDAAGLIGPRLVRPGAPHLRTELPLRKKKRDAAGLPALVDPDQGDLPLARSFPAGPFELRSVICPADTEPTRQQVRSTLHGADGADVALSREWAPLGRCAELRETVAGDPPAAGAYHYAVRIGDDPAEGLAAEQEFELLPAGPGTR